MHFKINLNWNLDYFLYELNKLCDCKPSIVLNFENNVSFPFNKIIFLLLDFIFPIIDIIIIVSDIYG